MVMKEELRTVELCYNIHDRNRIFVCRYKRVSL